MFEKDPRYAERDFDLFSPFLEFIDQPQQDFVGGEVTLLTYLVEDPPIQIQIEVEVEEAFSWGNTAKRASLYPVRLMDLED